MAEQQPKPLDQALSILLNTCRGAHELRTKRYQTEKEAKSGLASFTHLAGRAAVDFYMKNQLPTEAVIGDAAKELALAGWRRLYAGALAVGVDYYLTGVLDEADDQIRELLENQVLEAAPITGVNAHAVIGIQTPGGTNFYGVPEVGVSGRFAGVDSGEGRLLLEHPEVDKRWQVEVFHPYHDFQSRVQLSTIPTN